jgi:hypothetical protein
MREAAATDAQRQHYQQALGYLDRVYKELAKPAKQPGVVPGGFHAQLVISASKRLLDRMAAGGITFRDFRQEASVELRNPAEAEKNASSQP